MHSTETSNKPSSSHEQVQAINVLRSGKIVDKTILPKDLKGKVETFKKAELLCEREKEPSESQSEEVLMEEDKEIDKENEVRKEKNGFIPNGEEAMREEREILAHAPFPHRLSKPKHNLSSEIYENFETSQDKSTSLRCH